MLADRVEVGVPGLADVGRVAGVDHLAEVLEVGGVEVDDGGAHRREVDGELGVVADAVGQRLRDPVQLVQQDAGVGGPGGAVAGGGAGDERVDVRRQPGHPLRGRRDVVVHVPVGDLDRGLALVRLAAGEQLVEHDAGGVHVGAGVGAAVDDELGGQVGDGADEHAVGGGVLGVGADRLGEPEVGDLDPAVVGDEHVLRLHVAVHEAGAVGRRQRGEHRLQHGQRPRRRHRRLLDDGVAQRVAGDQLHHQEDGAVVVALVEDRDDVGVREPGGGAGLAHEALGEVAVVVAVAEAGVHHLDGDGAVEPDVEGLVDAGHAAAGDARADPVAAVEQAARHPGTRERALLRHGPTPLAADGEGSGAAPSYGRAHPATGLGGARRGVGGVPSIGAMTQPLADVDLAALVPDWLDWDGAAQQLGITPSRVRVLVKEHRLAAAVPAPGREAVGAGRLRAGRRDRQGARRACSR